MKKLIVIAFQFLILTSYGQWSKSDKSPNTLASNDKIEFDPAFSFDGHGNTYYCWTDFRNGNGELFAQKLNKFGVAQWSKNGVKVGEVVKGINFSLTKKSIIGLRNGNVAIAWHQIGNVVSTNQKSIFVNQISSEGNAISPNGEKIGLTDVFNNDLNEAILTLFEDTSDELKLVYSLYNGSGAEPIYLKTINVTAKPADLLINTPALGLG